MKQRKRFSKLLINNFDNKKQNEVKIKKLLKYLQKLLFVRIIGLEPTRLAAPDPKSGTSTNFAISAVIVGAKIGILLNYQSIFSKFFLILFFVLLGFYKNNLNGKY